MATVPSRLEWRAEEDSKKGTALVQAMKAFGWIVHRHILPVGYELITKATKPVPRSLSPNLTLYVKGLANFTHEDGTVFEDRVPGMYSGDRPDTPAGVMTHKVIDELEYWCFNWHANRGALPELEVFRLKTGDLLSVNNRKVILCCGTLGTYESGTAFVHDKQDLIAEDICYGFFIGANRD